MFHAVDFEARNGRVFSLPYLFLSLKPTNIGKFAILVVFREAINHKKSRIFEICC